MRWRDLGFVFFDCRVSLLLCGWWLIDSNWKKLAGCGRDTATSKRKRWQNHGVATGECAPTEVAIFFVLSFFGALCHAITSPPRRAFAPSLWRSERLGSGLIPP